MAKRKTSRLQANRKLVPARRDCRRVIGRRCPHSTQLADGVVRAAQSARELHLEIPSRTLSNVRYSPRKRIIEMGKSTNRRQLFNLSQAKAYMQTMLVGSGCKRLIEQGKTTSIRGLFYLLKHTIEGTKEETFQRPERVRSDHRRCRSAAG